jgi:formyl-CoA transferase/CoA:oxalate CoA-transferase
MGASVVHVEGPRGDPQQRVPPTIDGVAACYINFNTSKRSIFLDLTDTGDCRRMWQLIESSDVLVNNFKPSSVQRLGFTPEAVMSRNPDIVYCMSNGWGEFGPLANKTGTDPVLQYFGGWCSVTGDEGGSWEALRFFGHIDLNASMYVAAAVLTALATRTRLGGQMINVSMLETTLAMQSTRIAEYLHSDTVPGPLGSAASGVAPSQAFLCEDQRWVAVSAETEGQWQRLCEAINRRDLADDPEYATNALRVAKRTQLSRELSREFLSRPAWWWIQQLTSRQVPCSTFWDFDLINVHPQVRDNDHVIELDAGRFGTVFTGGPPWKFSRAPARVFRNPEPGEHTAEVLAELDHQSPARPAGAGARVPGSSGLPFSGRRVLELATGIAGPYCGSLFADQGADVLKLEPPGGDRVRAWGPPFGDGVGATFVELNRNKRIAEVPGISELLALAKDADVIIVDSVDPDGHPPVLNQEELGASRPELIMCSISAYGGRGPLAGHPGSELTVQAMSNTWAGLGTMGQEPRRIGVDQAMMNAGLAAYQAVTAAIFRLERTGEGDLIHVSALGTHHAIKGMHWTCLSRPDQWPGAHLTVWTSPEDHGDIRALDRPIAVAFSQSLVAQSDPEQVRAIIKHFGGQIPPDMDLAQPLDPRWRSFWSSLFAFSSWEEVAAVVEDHGGTVTPWMDYADLDHHPQVLGLAPFVRLEDTDHQRVVRLPWRVVASDGALTYRRPVAIAPPQWQ